MLFGVDRYQGDTKGEKVATVDGHDITRPEWDLQHRNEVGRIREQAPNIDPALLDSDAARYSTLERMVRDRVLAAAAAKANITVSEERLARLFAEDSGLASFRTADGKFDRERFVMVTGRTPEQYEASVRADLSTQQVLLGISGTAFATRAQADLALNAFFDRREIQVARFGPADFSSKVSVSDTDVEAYYKEHASQFQAPEQVNIQYLVLDLEAAKKNIVVSEADLQSYYQQNGARFGSKEERRASHILINAPTGASAADREKARAKAEQLLAQVKKDPASFADVARKNSQDPGSAEKGGDLDFVTRGAMTKPFEDALFALKKGEISGVVETEFGYHIIELTDIKPTVMQPFAQVRSAIENEVRSQQATQEFAKAAEVFTDAVYQQPDTLQGAADKLKLPIQTANNVPRVPAPGATGALASRNFLAALYAPEALERKQNTEAMEIGPNQLASGRVTQYSPARTLPLAEVKDRVRAQLMSEKAAALAKTEGQAKLAAWQANATGAALASSVAVSRLETQSLPQPLIEAALRADSTKLPVLVGVDLGSQGYAVVRVNKLSPRAAPAGPAAQQELEQFTQAMSSAENAAYYNLLKERFKAHIAVPKPADPILGATR
ncbi:peptidyl-prolyl cis-trans isomerase D [Variovorax ginsengisoli]|uniref:Periplasmic chaperone PpiD n=1 Tax=Variovorax ginsengisoli TaxID=363844 RepID=A0ABT9S7Q7_9BURK|nr:peptidyl-prolyl cis-trans isomerase D [Variovorax ginsengisoli]